MGDESCMDLSKQSEKPRLEIPPPVDLPCLRTHFRTAYKLDDTQVELMVQSSAKSLNIALAAAAEAMKGDDIHELMCQVGHSLKGLLLNMGQPEWAGVAKRIEGSAKEERECDYSALLETIRLGLAEVIDYEPGK
jgi:hypothetical protein